MPKFNVYGVFTVTKFIGEFEAETQEAAEALAENSDNNHFSMCHQCSSEADLDDVIASRFFTEKLK